MNRDLIEKVDEEIKSMGETFETFRYTSAEIVVNTIAFSYIVQEVAKWVVEAQKENKPLTEIGIAISKGYILSGFQLGYCVARKELGLDIVEKGENNVV